MQTTRELILNILKRRGQATVNELSDELDLTTVTIRHHLGILRREDLVAAPSVRHRKAPGRPQHVYSLTEEATEFFPKRYEQLINLLLDEVKSRLSPDEVDEVMTCIGESVADQVTCPDGIDFEGQVAIAVQFMDNQDYMARWRRRDDHDYVIETANCPFEGVVHKHSEVCKIDHVLLTHILGPSLHRVDWKAQGDRHCSYVISAPDR